MKVKYVGPRIGVMTLTPDKIYDVLAIEEGMLRILDDDPNSSEGYLYDPIEPGNLDGTLTGKWEIVEDDEKGTLKNLIEQYK